MNNDTFIVSARKYRPESWESVVGQSHVTDTLRHAIESNHLAQAFLFCGPRGVGKTTCARIFAKAINQQEENEEEDYAFNIFELDAASNNSVDDIRQITDQVRIPPQTGKYKVYIIDEVHMLSQAAFNAFLKTLEEPPPYAIFILATTEKHKILPTILSRCQVYDFNRITVNDIAKHLAWISEQENIEADEDALHIIAEKADGALRDALSIFDQMVSFGGNHITYDSVIKNLNILDYDYYFKLTEHFLQNKIHDALVLYNEIIEHGFDGHNFIIGLASHLRNLLVGKDAVTINLLEVGKNTKEKYLEQSKTVGAKFLVDALNTLAETDVHYKAAKDQRLLVEITLMKLCSLTVLEEQKKNS